MNPLEHGNIENGENWSNYNSHPDRESEVDGIYLADPEADIIFERIENRVLQSNPNIYQALLACPPSNTSADSQQLLSLEGGTVRPIKLRTDVSFTRQPLAQELQEFTTTGTSHLTEQGEGYYDVFDTSDRTGGSGWPQQQSTYGQPSYRLVAALRLGTGTESRHQNNDTVLTIGDIISMPALSTNLTQSFLPPRNLLHDGARWPRSLEYGMYEAAPHGIIPRQQRPEASQILFTPYSLNIYDNSVNLEEGHNSMPMLTSSFNPIPDPAARSQINVSEDYRHSFTRTLTEQPTKAFQQQFRPLLPTLAPRPAFLNHRRKKRSSNSNTAEISRTYITERELAEIRHGYRIGRLTSAKAFLKPQEKSYMEYRNKFIRSIQLTKEENQRLDKLRGPPRGPRKRRKPTEQESMQLEQNRPVEEGKVNEFGERIFDDEDTETQQARHNESRDELNQGEEERNDPSNRWIPTMYRAVVGQRGNYGPLDGAP
jgi:hypothetical protein